MTLDLGRDPDPTPDSDHYPFLDPERYSDPTIDFHSDLDLTPDIDGCSTLGIDRDPVPTTKSDRYTFIIDLIGIQVRLLTLV